MDSRYVVEVSAPGGTAGPETKEALGRALRLAPGRVDALLRRLPDVVTRPLELHAAETVAGRFRSAGLTARVVSLAGEAEEPTPAPPSRPAPTLFDVLPEAPARPEPSAGDHVPAAARADAVRGSAGSTGRVWLETDTPPQGTALPPAPRYGTPLPESVPEEAEQEEAEQEEAVPAGPAVPTEPLPEETPAAGPENLPDTAAYEAISPAELLARLRGEEAVSAAMADGGETAPATGPAAAGRNRLQGRLRGKLLELAVAPALFTLLGALAGGWYAWSSANPGAGLVAFLGSSMFTIPLAAGGTLLVIGMLFATRRAAALTRNVRQLTARADAISRGELEESIEFSSGDEFEQLAEAIERMRVGMRGAFERLRRTRRL